MSDLDDDLKLRFGDQEADPPENTGRDLLFFDLDSDDGEFPPSLMVTWQGLTWVLVFTEVESLHLLQMEAWGYHGGQRLPGSPKILTISHVEDAPSNDRTGL